MLNNHSCVESGDEAREKSTKHRLSLVYVYILEECSGHRCTAQTLGRNACT